MISNHSEFEGDYQKYTLVKIEALRCIQETQSTFEEFQSLARHQSYSIMSVIWNMDDDTRSREVAGFKNDTAALLTLLDFLWSLNAGNTEN